MNIIAFIIINLCLTIGQLNAHVSNFVMKRNLIMLDPAGHAGHVGRKLSHGYERGETLKLAESLQKLLLESFHVRTILNRAPGEQKSPLQGAIFANRLNVDFFLSIHLYNEETAKPKVFLYQLAYDPLSDFARRSINPLEFTPLNRAHFKNIHTTKAIGEHMKTILTEEACLKQFDFNGPFIIPAKPLIGITAPALILEIGISKDNQWHSLIEPIAKSLNFLIAQQ